MGGDGDGDGGDLGLVVKYAVALAWGVFVWSAGVVAVGVVVIVYMRYVKERWNGEIVVLRPRWGTFQDVGWVLAVGVKKVILEFVVFSGFFQVGFVILRRVLGEVVGPVVRWLIARLPEKGW